MFKLQPRERHILFAAIGLLGLFGVDRLVITPIAQSWNQLDQALDKKREQLAHDKRLLADSKSIRKQYAAYAVSQREPGEGNRGGDVTRLLKEIESLARSNGVKISDVRPQNSGRSMAKSSVMLSVEAKWENLVRFLYQLQRSAELLRVDKASILRKNDETSQLSGRLVIARNDEL